MCAASAGPQSVARDRYAVAGQPVEHSLSPLIHTEFARLTGEPIEYGTLEVGPERFADAVRAFFDRGGRGLNVTMPHKHAAFALCDAVTMRARVGGAVNTLSRDRHGAILGDVTDGDGLLNDLREHLGVTLADRRILILGAGGSVAGCLAPLLSAQPAGVHVANRTAHKARVLAADFAGLGPVTAGGLDEVPAGPYALVINATGASMAGERLPIPATLIADALCYDLMYAPRDTPFTAWASANGARAAHTGIGMLVEQAALSFEIWRGVRPDTASVRRLLAHERGFRF